MTARLAPLSPLGPQSATPLLDDLAAFVGYRPNALLTMARKSGLLPAVLGLVAAALRGPGELPLEIRFLAACEASRHSGCFYSTVHSVHAAHHAGVEWAKLSELDRYAVSSRFSERERVALAIAGAGGTLPTRNAGPAFDEAKVHFTESQILEIVAVVALFGWFNRWNSLIATELEDVPAQALHHVPWLAQWQRSINEASGASAPS